MEKLLDYREFATLKASKLDDERISTVTSREQESTENSVEKCFDRFMQLLHLDDHRVAKLYREEHQRFLETMLHRLPGNYECLDSSRPWCIHWIMQAAHALNFTFAPETLEQIVQFLVKCRHPQGGFAGGPGQYPHLAPTYAAVNSLAMVGTPSAFLAIDRDSLEKFLFSVRQPDGSFRLHVDGETDVRGAYCAVAVAKLTNMPEETIRKLFDKTGDWIASCQTYEGGFGGAPDLEAHGGYTFCGVAALALLNEGHKWDHEELMKWTLQRQMAYEGGFQGRTNKLVDGCYSFWVGATISIMQSVMNNDGKYLSKALFDVGALQEYIILCCQKTNGGLLDKPGKPQDLYHTCYTLCGIGIAQHSESAEIPAVLGHPINEVQPTHPLFNVAPEAVAHTTHFYEQLNKLRSATQFDVKNNSDDEEINEDSVEEIE